MMNTVHKFLIVTGLLLLVSFNGSAQQKQDASISRLKEQIQSLLEVERDETTPAEVRELNRSFIRDRRIQLRALIQENAGALRKYLASAESSLQEGEKEIVQNRIKQAEDELKTLDKQLQENSSAELGGPEMSSSVVSSASTPSATVKRTSASTNGDVDVDGASNLLLSSSASPAPITPTNPNGQNPPQGSTSLNANLNGRIKARIEQTDNTKQTETPSISSNSTSLVDQSSASDLIGVATNLAGLSATSNSNEKDVSSVSVTASAYALLAALNRVDPLNPVFYNEHRAWRNFSITLGYDDEDQPNGTKQRAKLFGAKYLFVNRRDPNLQRNRAYIDAVASSLGRAAAAFGDLSIRVRGYAFTLDAVRKNLVLPGFKKFLEQRKLEKELALERKRNEFSVAAPAEQPNIQKQIAALQNDLSRIDKLLETPQDELLVLGTNHLPSSAWTREEKEYQVQFLNEYLGANYREKLGQEASDTIDRFIDQQLDD